MGTGNAASWPEGGLPHGEHPYDYGVPVTARDVRVVQDEIVTECVAALSHFPTDDLRAVQELAERTNPDGWLPQMIREFVGVWR